MPYLWQQQVPDVKIPELKVPEMNFDSFKDIKIPKPGGSMLHSAI
jgi:hypothetical protein